MEDIRRMEEETQKELEEVICSEQPGFPVIMLLMDRTVLSPLRGLSAFLITDVLMNLTLDASEGRCARDLSDRRVEARRCRSDSKGRLSKSQQRRMVLLHGSLSTLFITLPSGHCLTQPFVRFQTFCA